VICPLKQLYEAKIVSLHCKNVFLLTTAKRTPSYAQETFLQLLSPAWSCYNIENIRTPPHRTRLCIPFRYCSALMHECMCIVPDTLVVCMEVSEGNRRLKFFAEFTVLPG